MKLSQSFPKTAFLLSSILFVSVSGGRKTHLHKSTAATAATSPVATQIVESDHVAASSAISQQPSMTMAQSRSSALANERASNAGYSQPIYSSQYDPSMMSDPSLAESSYYDPMMPSPHHHHHHQAAAAAQHAAASGLYHHHVPAPAGVGVPHARHAGAVGAGAASASSVAPYAATPYGAHQAQAYYGGYGYDYPNRYAAQGSHQDAYVAKRAHGYGGYGWHPDLEIQTLFFIGIPLIIIPLLFLWPYFLYSLHYRGGGGGHHGGYGYRSAAGDAEVVSTPKKELKAKTDELTKKILPKLSKKSDKTSKSSDKTSKSSDKSTKSSDKSSSSSKST